MDTREPDDRLLHDPLRTPRPIGLLSGKRTWTRRFVSKAMGAFNRMLDRLPFTHWLHRRIRNRIAFTPVDLQLGPEHAALDGLKVAFLSDVHAGSFLDEDDIAEICRRVQATEPDLVLFGGDLINTRDREILLFRKGLRELRPRYGIYAVPGNHDHFYGPDIGLWRAFLEDHGVVVMMNDGVRIEHGGGSLWLCGVDDLTEGEPEIGSALAGRRDGEPTILVSHHPDFFFEAAASSVDLQLSGHTHGGQIRVGGYAPIHHSRFGYERGCFTEGNSRLYVGRGVGVTLLPIRIDAEPEIPIVTVRATAMLTEQHADQLELSTTTT